MKVYLIRHARTRDAEDLLTQRHTTPIVVDSETLDKVEQVKNKIGDVDFVFCSPLQRARETADLIFGEGNYKVLDFIQEYKTPKEIIGKPRKFATDYWEVIHKQDKMNIYWEPKGGESFFSVAKRAEKLYRYLLKEKENKKYQKIAIVGHGTFFRHFLLQVANVPWTKYPQLIFDVLRKLRWDNLQVVEVEL
jgi:broad specificity phosphatase PhoE